ncbi:hypothetical protein AB4Z18_04005 [Leifsonia sp. 2TAF2]|uniref:hypothetical protein n=1 Tax=Leifsonia sp. 2TAF2 TaxID=3233009 RepID=UPI003F9E0EEA
MSTVTRTADPTGAAVVPTAATGAVAVDGPSLGLPVVLFDLPRAAQRLCELREALPWMDVRFDVSALAHPELLRAIAAEGAGFTVSHPAAVPALRRAGIDLGRALYAVSGAHWQDRRSAWEAGVRLFAVDEPYEVDAFVAAPAGTSVLLRMPTDAAVASTRRAVSLGVPVAGLSLDACGPSRLAADLRSAVGTLGSLAALAAEAGGRVQTLDLGDVFGRRPATRSADWAELGRTVRSLVAPAISRTTVLATAGRTLVADCITVVAGQSERYADPASASAYIDAGAEVVVLRDGLTARTRITRTSPARHRILPSRARTTWSPAG